MTAIKSYNADPITPGMERAESRKWIAAAIVAAVSVAGLSAFCIFNEEIEGAIVFASCGSVLIGTALAIGLHYRKLAHQAGTDSR